MKLPRSHRLSLALGLACTLIAAGCQDRTMRVPYIFQIAPETGAPTAAVLPAGRTPVTDPAVPKHLGVVTVNIQGFLNHLSKKRRVFATVADVSYVIVLVKAADGAEFSQTIEKAAIVNGQTTATFSGLAPGDANITMKAFDATHRAIGSTTATAMVAAGQSTPVALTLTLDPTYTGGSGGGSTSSTGSVTTSATIQDGPVVSGTPPATVGSFQVPHPPTDLAIGNDGDVWVVLAHDDMDGSFELVEYAPTGTLKNTWSHTGSVFGMTYPGVGLASDGSFWLSHPGGTMSRYNAAGQVQATGHFGGAGVSTYVIRLGPDGVVWTVGGDEWGQDLVRFSSDGQATEIDVDGVFADLDLDAAGNVWAVGQEPSPSTVTTSTEVKSYLYKVSPAGAIVSRHATFSQTGYSPYLPYQGVAVDETNPVWFSNMANQSISCFDPTTSTTSGPYFAGWRPTALVADAQKRIWVAHEDGVSRLSASGQVAETIPLKNVFKLRAGASGVWALTAWLDDTPATIYQISH